MNRRRQPLRAASALLGLVLVAGLLSLVAPGAKAAGSPTWLTWTEQFPAASPPPAPDPDWRMNGGVMAYFPPTRQVVLLGWEEHPGVGRQSEMWTWDGVTWTRLNLDPIPAPREHAVMTYDSARERLVLFGGFPKSSPDNYLGDTWTYGCNAASVCSWSDVTPLDPAANPAPRGRAAMAFDAERGEAVLFGGLAQGLTPEQRRRLDDTWIWNGTIWAPRAVTGPGARQHAGMVFDADQKEVVLFGGSINERDGGNYGEDADDTWTWDGVAWTPRILDQPPVPGVTTTTTPSPAPNLTSPSARHKVAFAYDPSLQRAVLFGGMTGGDYDYPGLNDTWLWDGTAWTEIAPAGKPSIPAVVQQYDTPNWAPKMVHAPSTRSLVMFDGTRTWHFGAPPLRLEPPAIPANVSFSSQAVAEVRDLDGAFVTGATVQFAVYGPGAGAPDETFSSVESTAGTFTASIPASGNPGRRRVTATSTTGIVSSASILTEFSSDLPEVSGLSPSYGWTHGGTQVQISGKNLASARSVRFGTTELSTTPCPTIPTAGCFTVNSASQITAVSPAHQIGEVNVTVTGPAGTSGTGPATTFSYYTGSSTPTGQLNAARLDHTATVLGDGGVLVVGGRPIAGAEEAMASTEKYDSNAQQWSLARPLTVGRREHTATLLAPPGCRAGTPPGGYPCGQVLVTGGLGSIVAGSPAPPVLATAEMFDPATDAWTTVPSLTSCSPSSASCAARAGHTAILLDDGRVLVAGGEGGLASVQIFDPKARSWSPAASLSTGRGHHAGILLGTGKALVAGGLAGPVPGPLLPLPQPLADDDTDPHLGSVELYDPVQNRWSSCTSATATAGCPSPLGRARPDDPQATLLNSGNILVTGGCSCGTGEVFKVGGTGAGRWTDTMGAGLVLEGSVAALVDGRIAVLGGGPVGTERRPGDAVVLYDPATNSWVRDYHLAVPRAGHTASLLANGKVLVVGGVGQAGTGLADTELYDPTLAQDLLGPVVTRLDPPSGPTSGGTRVTISGSNFVAPLSVRFGDVPASAVEVVSELKLVATSPPQLQGEFSVTVTRTGLPASAAGPGTSFTYGAGAWKPARTSMGPPRFNHTATRLPDNTVLVAGGTEDYFLWSAISTRYTDGSTTEGSNILTKKEPGFVPEDVGRSLTSENLPSGGGAKILEVVDPRTVRLSVLATKTQPKSATEPLVAFIIDHDGCRTSQIGSTRINRPGCTTDRPNPAASLSSVLLYDPQSEGWSATGSMRAGRQSHTSTLLADGRVLVAGGIDGLGKAMRSAEIYNPSTRTWAPTPDMNVARLSHTATLLGDGRVLVAGGAPSEAARSQALSSAEIYDPAANSWTSTPALPSGHVNHTAVLLAGPGCGPRCGQVLVAGGMAAGGGATKGNASAKVDLFDPATFTWSAQPEMTVGRLSHASVQLPGGKVLVAGGFVADGVTTISVELYDPARGTWAPTGSMRRPDANTSAVLLSDGTVLVAGGGATYPVGITTNSAIAQVYEPSTGRWNLTSPLAHPRSAHTLTLLDTGSVLVTGGYSSASSIGPPYTFPAADELYVPAPVLTGITPPAGPLVGGTLTTITGAGFTGVTSIAFGDTIVATTPCSPAPTAPCFSVDSPTRITAVTPPHVKGRVPLTADGPGGTSRRLSTAPPSGLVARFAYLEEPGAVALAAVATSPTEVRLTLSAPDDGGGEPATIYVVKQSVTEIVTQADFDAATAFVLPPFSPAAVGDELRVDIADLAPATTYHYAARAVNLAGLSGPISGDVSVATPPAPLPAGSCPAISDTSGGIRYPSGYSLVGLPAGTTLGSASPLYAWFDLGAGGAYSTATSTEAGRGYWAWSACPRVVQLPPTGAASARFALGGYHASMVGNPSATAPATVGGHDFAAAWDPSLNAGAGGYHISAYRERQTLAVGAGTWLFSYVPTEIRIDAAS